MKRFIISMTLAAVCLCSCDLTPDILYRAMLFGDMQGETVFRADDNCTYHFTNITASAGLPTSGRLLAYFDVRKQVEGTENEFEATLNDYRIPIVKDPVLCLNKAEEIALGYNEIRFDNGTISGGYLNTQCTILRETELHGEPNVNLQLMKAPDASSDTLHFVLRYNSGKDVVADFTTDIADVTFYACFPIADLLFTDKKTVVEVKWLWDGTWNKACTTI